jgi:hypothetical protein
MLTQFGWRPAASEALSTVVIRPMFWKQLQPGVHDKRSVSGGCIGPSENR